MLHFRVGADSFDLLLELVGVVVAAETSRATAVHVVDEVVVSALVDDIRVKAQSLEVIFPLMGERVAVEVHLSLTMHVVFHVIVVTVTDDRPRSGKVPVPGVTVTAVVLNQHDALHAFRLGDFDQLLRREAGRLQVTDGLSLLQRIRLLVARPDVRMRVDPVWFCRFVFFAIRRGERRRPNETRGPGLQKQPAIEFAMS